MSAFYFLCVLSISVGIYIYKQIIKQMSTQPQTLVKNLEKLSRPIIFDNMSRGFQLTDIDFLWEYKNRFLFVGEVKEFGKDITIGQKISTTRIINSWNSLENRTGIVIFAQHDPNVNEIILSECIVKKIYDGEWKELKKEIKVKDFVDSFLRKYDVKFN